MMDIKILNILNDENIALPSYATPGSAGLDLRSSSKDPIIINPNERILVPTGIAIELPQGYEAQIRSRSGLAFKNGVVVINAPGTIDSDYRGEIKVILGNLSNEKFTINFGDKIAQMIIAKHEIVNLVMVNDLTNTQRQNGGFGSTGIK
jgi:dUTP pyrophosphatase